MYVGVIPHLCHRLKIDETENKKKEQKEMVKNDGGIEKGEKGKDQKERKISLGQCVDDGLLLVVTAKIYGQNVRALTDSGATSCFFTPTCINMCGLKAKSRDIFLELGNGEKFLSRGFIPDVPVVTVGLTVKLD